MSNLFCVIFAVFEKVFVVSFYCVCIVFGLFFLHLSVCCVSLWLIPHLVGMTNLRIHGMYVCIYVCMCVCNENIVQDFSRN
jgi:hypothetical protein